MNSGRKKKLVYFGNERLVSGLEQTDAPILRALIDNDYDVVAVVSHHSETRSRKSRPLEVAEIAEKHNIPVFLPENPLEIYDELAAFGADAAVLAAYGKIVSGKLIDLFPRGIINIHPSLLPRYRGPTPIEAPILNGDNKTGVSIMQLSPGLDEGPVFAQQEVSLSGNETKFELYDTLKPITTSLLLDCLPSILDGTSQPTPQDNTLATYCERLEKSDGLLDPSQLTASEAERRIRAHLGFPQSRLQLGSVDIIITKAHISATKTDLSVECKDGKFLAIDQLKPIGKKEMPVKAFLAGYKNRI